MKFHDCEINIKTIKNFGLSDEKYKKLFLDALNENPCFLAFDIDFDYDGVVAKTGTQINRGSIKHGSYSIENIGENEFSIKAHCVANAELMFMNESGFNAFKKALADEKLRITIMSVCNNGESKETFWSMACPTPLVLNSEECFIK